MGNTVSLWQKNAELPRFEKLSEDISTDVLVIGGGFAGLMTAYLLHEKGADCVLLEKDRICGATTAKTTAKITALHGLCYSKILKTYGKEYAQMYYYANNQAIEGIKSLCHKAGIYAEEKESYVYSFNQNKVYKEVKAFEKMGIKYKYTDSLPLPVTAASAVGFENQGQFNPIKLAGFLVKGLKIFENTKVQEMIGTTAVTPYGKVKAKKVVVATHFPFINKHGSYFLKLYQHRSYIIALKNAQKLDAMYVDNSKTGLSFSSFGEYLLLCGAGHRTAKQGCGYKSLRAFADEHYKSAEEILNYSAQDTISLDGIPYIGKYSKNTPDLYIVSGFNKWGITSSFVGGEIISADILGKSKDYDPVFSPQRSIIKPQLVVNGFEAVKNLITPTTRRCPHLGCALKYNKYEHSFDCACHGSRFSENGKVLDGPANDNLKMN